MGQIVGGAAKPKRCNLNELSQLGIPAAGEHILVSSDNSMNAAGQGNFDCYIVGDGHTAATALPLIKTYANDMDNEPTAGSDNLVKSGGVFQDIYGKQIQSIDWTYTGTGNKYFIDTTNIVSGSKLLIQIISEVQPDINVVVSVSGDYQTITKIQDNKWHPVVIPDGITSSQLTFTNIKDATYDVHVYVRRITDISELNYELSEIISQLNEATGNNNKNADGIKILNANIHDKFLNYNLLQDSTKKLLDSIADIDFMVDAAFANDSFAIKTYGVNNNGLVLNIYDVTRDESIVSFNIPLSTLNDNKFKTISAKNNYAKVNAVINTGLVNAQMGIVTTANIGIQPNGTIELSQFSNFNLSNANEKARVNAITSFNVVSKVPVVSSDIYLLTAFGWTSASSLYGYLSINKNGNLFINGTFDKSTTYPTGIKTYTIENDNARVTFTVDWSKLSDNKWYNSNSSQLTLRHVDYILDDESLMATPYRNLFNFSVYPNKYLMSTGGLIQDLSGWFTSRFIKVVPGKTYKCSIAYTRICYYGSTVESSVKRTLTPSGSTKLITPQTGENYVRFSCRISTSSFETIIVSEVQNADEELKLLSLSLTDEYLKHDTYEDMVINGYLQGEFTKGDNTTGTALPLSVESDEKMFYIPLTGDYVGTIKKLRFNCTCDSAFNLTIGTGIIDQRGWGLVYSSTTVNVTNGVNDIDLTLPINKSERLFIIANSASTAANASINVSSRGYHRESGNDGITMSWVAGEILMQYVIEGRMLTDSTLASKESMEIVSENVSDIENQLVNMSVNDLFITSPNDTYYKIKVANDGTLSTELVPVQGKILTMGNSYDASVANPPIWWGDFGMAASRKENDWQRTLLRKLRTENDSIYNLVRKNIAGWETKGWGTKGPYDYSELDEVLADTYSMIIIRVGENSLDTDLASIQTRVETLLDYIISKVGNTIPILWGGCVKIRTLQNPAMQAACANYSNVTYVDMEPAGKLPVFAAGLDWRVFGSDNRWHTVSESSMAGSVAGHPKDEVFAKMAELFYPVVVEKLGI